MKCGEGRSRFICPMRFLPTALILAICASQSLLAAETKKTAGPQPRAIPAKPPGLGLKDGDRFIFIGDSITHQCLYTQFVEDFYFTRHPDMRIKFRNAGVSGDRAADVLDRFDEDIARFKPTVATVLLGMNDGSYKDFDAATFQAYERDMLKLMDQLDAIQCRVILMSPTMFDHQAWDKRIIEKPEYAKGRNVANYNAVLAYYGKWLQETARKRGCQFVDLFGPLNTFTVQQRKIDPSFTLIEDAIHPGPDGQLVMAYSLLQQTGETGGILGAGARLVGGAWKPTNPAMVMDVSGEFGRSVAYTVKPKALPWTVFEAAPIGSRLTRAGHTASQESHIVVGLQGGRYDLIINGRAVGNFDERMLAVHAEIEEDPDSPTYQQAMRVVALNQKRNDEAIHPLRDLYGRRKGMLRAARMKNDMKEFDSWIAGEFRAKQTELEKKAEEYENAIHQAAQLKPLRVEVKPAPAPVRAKPSVKAPPAKKAA